MAKIPYFYDPETADESVRKQYEGLKPLNILKMIGHAGPLLEGYVVFGRAVLRASLDPVIRQSAILRVAELSEAPYPLGHHVALGEQVGMSAGQIAAARQGSDAPEHPPLLAKALRFTEQLVASANVDGALFRELDADLGHRGIQELVLAIGYYMMVCRFANVFGVDPEDASEDIRLVG